MKFEAGKTYRTHPEHDYEYIVSVHVALRLDDRIWASDDARTCPLARGRKFRILTRDGVETIAPWGLYETSPLIKAA